MIKLSFCYHLPCSAQTMAKRPVSALGNKRPVSEYARVAGAMGGHPRFKVSDRV